MKRKKKWKWIILSVLAVILAAGGLYAYSEYNRKVRDLSTVKAGVRMEAHELIAAFEEQEALANKNYLDKVIAVKGTVKSVEKSAAGHLAVVLGEPNSLSSVRCSMDSTHQQDVGSLVPGTVVTLKGACTGFSSAELLGSDVILNRCVIDEE